MNAIERLREALARHRADSELLGGRNFDAVHHDGLAENVAALDALYALAEKTDERDALLRKLLATESGAADQRAATNFWRDQAVHQEAKRKTAEAALAEARQALKDFGRHKQGCHQYAAPGLGMPPKFSGQECNCGYADALADTGGDTKHRASCATSSWFGEQRGECDCAAGGDNA